MYGTERVISQMKHYTHEAGAISYLHRMRIGGLEHKHVMPALREEEMRMKEAAAA